MFDQVNKVLILAPHPDDAEFGVGGTITKLEELGKEIHVAVFSLCEKSTPEGFEVGSIEKEFYESCAFLGIPRDHLYVMDFEVRTFPSKRQELLEKLVELRRSLSPDLVFLPSSSDIHQDHHTIYEEGIRAFKHTNLLGYEMPWNNFGFTSYVYVQLSSAHLEKKLAALNLYKTQTSRAYSDISFVEALAKLRGVQIRSEFAESFEMIRFIQR